MRLRWQDPAYRNRTVSAIRNSAAARTPRSPRKARARQPSQTEQLIDLIGGDGMAEWRPARSRASTGGSALGARKRRQQPKLGSHGLATAPADQARADTLKRKRSEAVKLAAATAAARASFDDLAADSDEADDDEFDDAEIQTAASRQRMRVTRAAAAAALGQPLPDGGLDEHADAQLSFGSSLLGAGLGGVGEVRMSNPSSAPSTGSKGVSGGESPLAIPARRRGRPKGLGGGSGALSRQQQSQAQQAAAQDAQLRLARRLRHSLAELEIEPLHSQLFPQVRPCHSPQAPLTALCTLPSSGGAI